MDSTAGSSVAQAASSSSTSVRARRLASSEWAAVVSTIRAEEVDSSIRNSCTNVAILLPGISKSHGGPCTLPKPGPGRYKQDCALRAWEMDHEHSDQVWHLGVEGHRCR